LRKRSSSAHPKPAAGLRRGPPRLFESTSQKKKFSYGGKQHRLGTFATKQEAALAYDREARQRGESKPLNYESIAAAEEAAVQAQAGLPPPGRPPSGFYGVTANRKRWKAMVTYGGKNHCLGTFDTKQEAALAYDRKARARQCGKDKALNCESIAAAEAAAATAA
jgi:hypothetical protein